MNFAKFTVPVDSIASTTLTLTGLPGTRTVLLLVKTLIQITRGTVRYRARFSRFQLFQ
jgi:hypothetical protein